MKLDNQYYTFNQSETFLTDAISSISQGDIISQKDIRYVNLPCAFDIETSSFYTDAGEKHACCYCWQFGLNGFVIVGRNLKDDFPALVTALSKKLCLWNYKRLICYVHNLSYEFQWIRKMFTWQEIMANKIRQPFKALASVGIEFRCSYILSSYNLATVAKNLRYHKIAKLTEKMDYTKIRHAGTALTTDEISYAINDVLIVMAYISEEIELAGGAIYDIPLTNTGRVRRYCRKHSNTYRKKVSGFTLTAESYRAAKLAFQGGFTHANSRYVGKTLNGVGSYDFTSSYPYVMVSEKFPMSTPQLVEIKHSAQFFSNLNLNCCIFQITFYNLYSKGNDNFISSSRCQYIHGATFDNGRVYSAAELTTTITEIDFKIIVASYTFDNFKIGNFYACKKDFLPLQFVQAILKLYTDKTTLKGVEGKETEYLSSKGMLNSCYGMCVTDIVRDEYDYDNTDAEWVAVHPDLDEKIYDYNTDKSRFLFYLWGVYVTAYARFNLITNILKLGADYVYADTDSIKFLHVGKNQHIFDEYNQRVITKLKNVASARNIPFDAFQPKTIKGVSKLLGVFDFEGEYKQFRTLGAKRYCYTDDKGKLHLTVAGVNKKKGVGALKSIEDFTFNMVFDVENCGKLTHTYIDEEISGSVVDYLGGVGRYHELSAVHLEPTTYEMTLASEYGLFLNEIEGLDITSF